MAILVTGATGRVGSRLLPRLLAGMDERVRVLVRDAARAQRLRERGAEAVVGDVREADALERAVDGVEAVVHLAASFRRVPDEEARAVNQAATLELGCRALAAGGGRFVFVSTNLVYGPGRGRPASEADDPAPAGAYPESKAAAEASLGELHRSAGLDLRVLRLAFVYGEGDPHLVESLMWARRWPLHKRLHMVHHADVGQAVVRALRAPGLAGRTFNVADDAPVTAAELLRLNGEALSENASKRPLDDPWEGIVETTRSRADLGLRPIYPSLYTAMDAGAL